MVLCLFGVCLVCSAILGATYVVTEEPIAQASARALSDALGEVLPQDCTPCTTAEPIVLDGTSYECYTARDAGGNVAAYAVKTVSGGFGGPIELLVGVYPDGRVCGTKVLSHSETPGLGAKCATDEGFINQFKGFEGRFAVRKDGGDIDAITASTITSKAYVKGVEAAVKAVKSLGGQGNE
ncbi:MAG: RnfABCDGE type electron transport complex subunit G [Bacteroidales bacterium]|nr:RnfABCDGE type electron transport complex subunit G [Bacteroidales bacterium]